MVGEAQAPMPPRRPTITDVALQSGVAASTVSRAFTRPDRVNPATRERIEVAAKLLGYVPAGRPPGHPGIRMGSVAVLVPDITNPFFFDFIRSTQHQLRASGYTQMLVDTEEDVDLEASYLEEFQGTAAGFILAATRLEDAQLLPLQSASRSSPSTGRSQVSPPW